MALTVVVLALTLMNVVSPGSVGEVKDLHILGLFPMEGSWSGGKAFHSTVEMALHHVNERTDILAGYKLNMIWNDTQCNPGIGVNTMFEHLYQPPAKLLILGGGCSTVTEATARVSHLWNLVQVSYVSVSPALSNKAAFPRFFRTTSPDSMHNPARIALFKEFQWTKVAILHQSYELFSTVTDDLVSKLKDKGITVITSEIFKDNPALQIDNLKKHDARIIVAWFYEDVMFQVFCEAYKQHLYGPHIVWILVSWWRREWWKFNNKPTNDSSDCTPEQLEMVVGGSFCIGPYYLSPLTGPTTSGLNVAEFQELYANKTGNVKYDNDNMIAMGYDAVWSIALSLNDTDAHLYSNGYNVTLDEFNYDSFLGDIILGKMKEVEFIGISGYVKFNENGDLIPNTRIARIQDGEQQTVASYNPFRDNETLQIDWAVLRWSEGSPPKDSTLVIKQKLRMEPALYTIMCVIAFLGIILALAFLHFNWTHRNHRIVKMSSPRINNVILLGCIFIYASVGIKDFRGSYTAIICKIQSATTISGFSLVFGGLFSKTWRVHVIFTNKKLERKVVKDIRLLLMTFGLLIINLSVIVAWEIIDPVYIRATDIPTGEIKSMDKIVQLQVYHCTSQYESYFKVVIYVIQGIIMLIGAFLAWETRQVKFEALNDSRYIGICIYNVLVLSILGVILSFALDFQESLEYGIISGFLIFGTTTTQCLVFIPKILQLRDSQSHITTDQSGVHHLDVPSHKSNMTDLTVEQLKEEIRKKDTVIAQLRSQIQGLTT